MDRYNRQMRDIARGDDKFAVKAASCTLTTYEQQIRVNSTAGAVEIKLPPVVEAKGLMFSIIVETYVSAVTIVDQDDSYDWSDITHNGTGDGNLIYSDGYVWWVLVTKT
uniref:Uncharacterized protein n=1 Tax=viral metagenome TaxID=1070528 RepID=A0A6M3KT00_9ZZZZ